MRLIREILLEFISVWKIKSGIFLPSRKKWGEEEEGKLPLLQKVKNKCRERVK
jgi:hypothetical protein